MLPNDAKLRINPINRLDKYYVIVKNKAIYAVEKITKQLNIQKYMHMIYKQYFYKNKEKEIDDLFLEYIGPIMDNLDHPALIEERKKN